MTEQRDRWRAAALDIVERVRAEARYARDGRVYWLQPELPGREGPRKPLDSYLYPGSTGIALFFALAGRVLGEPELGTLAREILEPLRSELRRLADDPGKMERLEIRPGGLVGAGSWIYGLLRIGDLTRDEELWDDALALSVLLSPGRLAPSAPSEVMTGTAGALLALLALERRRPGANAAGDTAQGLAAAAGRALLARRESWLSREEGADLGFCHGAAGVLGSLSRLVRRFPDAGLAEEVEASWAALGGCRSLLRTLPRQGEPRRRFAATWCNGSVGFLLACLEASGAAEPELAHERLRALAGEPLDRLDHLCCGNLGRVDLLLHAAERLADTELLAGAEALAGRVLDRAEAEGGYRLMLHPEGRADVRLFPGLTGAGYTFLRLLSPSSAPSVLALV